MRQAFHRYLKVPFKPEFKYEPENVYPDRVDPKKPYIVAIVQKPTDEEVVVMAKNRLPVHDFGTCEGEKITIGYKPRYYGPYKYKSHAERKRAELEQILSYDDDRSVLLGDFRVIKHDLTEATLYLEELKRWTDAFVYAEGHCRYVHNMSVDNYYRNWKEQE